MAEILVVGSLNMDQTVYVDRFAETGETLTALSLHYSCGGKGANQAYAAACMHADVRMLGCIGADDSGKTLKEALEKVHADTSCLRVSPTFHTGTAVIEVDSHGSNRILVLKEANQDCTIEYLKENDASFQACRIVLLQNEIPMESVAYAIRRGHELGKTVIFNPAPAPVSFDAELYPMIDYLTPNETEVGILVPGSTSLEEKMKKLEQSGVKHVVVTLGEKGCGYLKNGIMHIIPTFPADAVDTVGAGDCYNGAMAAALAGGKSLDEALVFANAAGSLSVARKGAQTGMPTLEETEKLAESAR